MSLCARVLALACSLVAADHGGGATRSHAVAYVTDPLSHGTLVEADGRTRALAAGDFRVRTTGRWHSPHTNADYPAGWVLELPAEGLSLSLDPTVADQELEDLPAHIRVLEVAPVAPARKGY